MLSNESHARLIWCLMAILYFVVGLRYWALRRIKYKRWSPRGISSLCIALTVALSTMLCGMITWNLIGPYRDVVQDVLDTTFNAPAGVSLSSILGNSTSASNLSSTLDARYIAGRDNSLDSSPAPSSSSLDPALESLLANTASADASGPYSTSAADIDSALSSEDPDDLTSTLLSSFNSSELSSLTAVRIEYPDGTEYKFETVFKINFASMAIFYLLLWLVKASFLVIYFEFDWDLGEGTRKFLYVISGTIVLTFAFVELTHLMWCLPINENWNMDTLVQPKSCRSSLAPSVINSVLNVVTDLLVMAAGIAIIRSLNLGRNDIRAASLIILIACLTIITALVRMGCLIALLVSENKKTTAALHSSSSAGAATSINIPVQESVVGYVEVEAILAVCATCLPALRVLFRNKHVLPSAATAKTGPPTYDSQTSESNAALADKGVVL